MQVRARSLPYPWYPKTKEEAETIISKFMLGLTRQSCRACLAPHAGWSYSGKLAALSLSSLDPGADTLIVFGGHLGPAAEPLLALDDAFETPLGLIKSDRDLAALLTESLPLSPDIRSDNTVEIQLPLIRYLFPQSRILSLRLPSRLQAYDIGKKLAQLCRDLQRNAVAIGSSDLTHYGPHYGFTPDTGNLSPSEWIKTKNDAAFLDAVLDGKPEAIEERATLDSSSCSVGAVLGALGFAHEQKAYKSQLLAYATSADEQSAPNVVGYAAVSWAVN